MAGVAEGGRSFYGAALGLLARPTRLPRPPGDPANALTFPFAVRYGVLDRVERDHAIETARRLLDEGAEGVAFAFNPPFRLAGALDAPVADGVDAARTLVAAMLPRARLAVLAFDDGEGRIAVPGHLADAVREDRDRLDPDLARRELVAAARAAVARDPTIGALLLREPEMGPHAGAVAEAVGLGTWDHARFLAWFHAGLAPRTFPR